MLIFEDYDTLVRVFDVLGKCMKQWDMNPGLLVSSLVLSCDLSSLLLTLISFSLLEFGLPLCRRVPNDGLQRVPDELPSVRRAHEQHVPISDELKVALILIQTK
jgi:hypothetical protein